MADADTFYNNEYNQEQYAQYTEAEKHPFYKTLASYIRKYNITTQKVIEIGSGRGAFQDIVENYTGIDFADAVSKYYHKEFVCASASKLPFPNDTFGFGWSYCVLEHVPELNKALEEMVRVIENGGHLILRPAWHCHKWAADGYQVRPYTDFNIWGRIYKFFIPLFDWKPVRAVGIMTKRCIEFIDYFVLKRRPLPIKYGRLKANYEVFWQPDSDACNHIDPFSMILWFKARGHKCVSHSSLLQQFFIKTGEIDIEIRK